MDPNLIALKAAVVIAATGAKAAAKVNHERTAYQDEAFQLGRADAFMEVLRLIETVARLDDSK